MPYDKAQVREMIIRQHGGAQHLANTVGQSEGGSRQSQHESAIQFWTVALALLDEPGSGVWLDRAFAEAEIARHTAALAELQPRQSARMRLGGEAV
jgi:hypothetical protein